MGIFDPLSTVSRNVTSANSMYLLMYMRVEASRKTTYTARPSERKKTKNFT